MNNIFENACFGKAYKTRDGRKAVFLKQYSPIYEYRFELCIEKENDILYYLYKENGALLNSRQDGGDIVAEWEEANEEEKF